LLETNKSDDLDYTLLSLKGNPQAKYGVLQATTKKITKKSTPIWIPQHPGQGAEADRLKLAGWFSDDDKKMRCSVRKNVGANGVDYNCGAKAGGSGSPVENAVLPDGVTVPFVVALHQAEVAVGKCIGNGIWMSAICTDDANDKKLLVCAN
jgi:hypothetical protein